MKKAEVEKEKVRVRYKGTTDNLDVILATPIEGLYEDTSEKRVAVYVRVSTDDPRQTSSYELQKNYYTEIIDRRPGWNLYKIYADEGISGTSLKKRDAFMEMIQDCRDGKIDLVVTKDLYRFSRNIVDCIEYIRKLKELRPPVGVLFERDDIYSLNPDSEFRISHLAMMAQEESHIKSRNMDISIEMRFSRGIFLTPALLGYDNDEDGNLIINEDEAKTVRLIFFMYLYGYTCKEIAESLTSLGRTTKKQNTQWSPGSVLQILQNERHCGDVLSRKTWTPNYLDHKSIKNKFHKNQYRKTDHHEAIITRDDFIAVQHLINNAKYGNKGILPKLQVITEGALKGFVSVNPRWSGFNATNYINASRSVNDSDKSKPVVEIKANCGDFDFRGFEIARSQFFDTVQKISVTFAINELRFSAECIHKMKDVSFVELLLYPDEFLLAVRPASKDNRNSVKWNVLKDESFQPKNISGRAFLNTIYEIFGWKTDCRYRVRGIRKLNENESLYIFDMKETEIFIPTDKVISDDEIKIKPMITTQKTIGAYPIDWAETFGSDYYHHAQMQELIAFSETDEWISSSEGKPFNDSCLQVTAEKEIQKNIHYIIDEFKKKG